MQQDFGQPGTAQTLFDARGAVPPLSGRAAVTGPDRQPYFSHHFVGGNTYSTRLIGADTDAAGNTYPYPELSNFSFSSDDPESPYHYAYWENVSARGPSTQHARMAWDRLRNAVDVEVRAKARAARGTSVALQIVVTNSGAGHDFPDRVPGGRNAWGRGSGVRRRDGRRAVHRRFVLETQLSRRRLLHGKIRAMLDPNFPRCRWELPAGSPDPYAVQFRAVASRGDGCPTLELPYATPLNLVVDGRGLPVDANGRVIDRDNPLGLPRFRDLDHDGDIYDDAFLVDTRLRPLPDRDPRSSSTDNSVVVPEGIAGPIAVTAAVYYQSMEAVAARKLLGNLADTDGDHVLEPCVLRGPCDGRTPEVEPAVVEGSPPVPVRVASAVIDVEEETDTTPPSLATYPGDHATNAQVDTVPKVTASEPVSGIDETTFRLYDAAGVPLPAKVARIGDFTWGLFPDQVFLRAGATYFARLVGVLCDHADNCVNRETAWSFTVAGNAAVRSADTRSPPPPARPGVPLRPARSRRLSAVPIGPALVVGLAFAGLFLVRRDLPTRAARWTRLGLRRLRIR